MPLDLQGPGSLGCSQHAVAARSKVSTVNARKERELKLTRGKLVFTSLLLCLARRCDRAGSQNYFFRAPKKFSDRTHKSGHERTDGVGTAAMDDYSHGSHPYHPLHVRPVTACHGLVSNEQKGPKRSDQHQRKSLWLQLLLWVWKRRRPSRTHIIAAHNMRTSNTSVTDNDINATKTREKTTTSTSPREPATADSTAELLFFVLLKRLFVLRHFLYYKQAIFYAYIY